ncbi:MAG: hypothetical protein RMI90_13170, partial [Thermoguttaceae bacterium]|nr:hypothetical protein [Thermoguttaceae bacterium]
MALQKREKILLGIVLTALVLEVAFIAGPFSGPSRDELQRQYSKLSEEVAQKEKRLQQIQKKIGQELADWNRRSLPADPKIARAEYERWLVQRLSKSGLSGIRIEPKESTSRPGIYSAISLNIRCHGTLAHLAAFLYEFYSAGYLHKIAQMNFKRLENKDEFEYMMTIEGLALTKADSQKNLPEKTALSLPLGSPEKYKQLLVRRWMEKDRYVDAVGIFTPYMPPPPQIVQQPPKFTPPPPFPPPPPPPPPPQFDHAKYAFLTAITEVAGRPQVWIHARTKGQTYYLHEGDRIQIGSIDGTIGPIDLNSRSMQILVNGRSYQVRHGQTLYEAVNGPASANTAS